METCEDCDTQVKSREEVYCIKCGKTLCESCCIEFFCTICWKEETDNGNEKDFVLKLKPILAPLKIVLKRKDYALVVKMVKAWRDEQTDKASEIGVWLSGILTRKTMLAINRMELVVDDTIKYLDPQDVPTHPYKPVHSGFYIR